MDKTCATCKHRGTEPITREWATERATTYYECKRAMHGNSDSLGYENELPAGHQMLVLDGSGYHALLCVELTFGCNQWAKSPNLGPNRPKS